MSLPDGRKVPILGSLSNAEIVLLAAALQSGLHVRPKDQVDDAVAAVTVDQMLRAVVAEELERRELDVSTYLEEVVARALKVLPPEI